MRGAARAAVCPAASRRAQRRDTIPLREPRRFPRRRPAMPAAPPRREARGLFLGEVLSTRPLTVSTHMGKRIYCGNLSFQATEDDVRGLFAPHGEVTDVHVVMDRETGRSRGFAFVEMSNEAQAKAAITALDGFRHQDRNLKVNEAQPREERGGGG